MKKIVKENENNITPYSLSVILKKKKNKGYGDNQKHLQLGSVLRIPNLL